jgi:enoyl-CoA hydratase/carnithine racemase
MNASGSQLEVTRRGRIVVLTLRRPGSGNRMTTRMAGEITAVLDATRRDPQIGGCVMTGHGDVFCLGGDYRGAGPTTEGRAAYARALIEMDEAMSHLGKPLVAAVNGDAHAGGFGIVVGCDMAIAADDATLGLPEAAQGLFPFIAQAIVRDALPKKLFFDIVYNARLMDTREALRLHLINEAVPRAAVLERAIEVAEKVSNHNPEMLKMGRDLYYGMRGAATADALEQARVALATALEIADTRDDGQS